ncbi:iron ABC transporter permease [Algoriphagus kandeliae]|uniref:Iron ABC transporter permease n=1 Tax=Algoriphagus kandeliae TaxID=2562278 RepID=A0A4Y9QK30_9BACT|nr:iron ABC transporter permease [Algoriphagus kandeliae]TFV93061.1 iron ABC transporter permease [Algoriphagus kandeliae]
MKSNRTAFLFLVCLLFLGLMFLLNLSLGSVKIGFSDVFMGLFTNSWEKDSYREIILNFRLPKALVAILVGIGLSLSGLQMQTFFRNPLAGPYVLGISSGAGFGVAILLLAGSAMGFTFTAISPWSTAFAGVFGAGGILLLVSVVAWRVRDSMTLLIVGVMFGAAVSALISVMSYFSQAESLKLYTIWSLGSLGGLSWNQVMILAVLVLLGALPVIASTRSFNALLLGESYAESMGINSQNLRWLVILSTGVLAGGITAFCGPIAFVGIAVPHLGRLLWKSADHRILFPGSALVGAGLMLICDTISQLPGSAQTLPINAVTSLIGAPVVIGLVIKRNFSKEF